MTVVAAGISESLSPVTIYIEIYLLRQSRTKYPMSQLVPEPKESQYGK
jgi:hypothetical protein